MVGIFSLGNQEPAPWSLSVRRINFVSSPTWLLLAAFGTLLAQSYILDQSFLEFDAERVLNTLYPPGSTSDSELDGSCSLYLAAANEMVETDSTESLFDRLVAVEF